MGSAYYSTLSSYSRPSSYSSAITSSDALAALFAFIGGFLAIIIIIAIAIIVLQIIANWKLFTKAGEKGWKAIIPFYNTAILYKISGMSPWLALLYIGFLIPGINIIVGIAFAVLNLYQPINLAKGFKKSTGFTVGLIMLPFIFNLILGLGDSKYYGYENTKPTSTPTPESKPVEVVETAETAETKTETETKSEE